MRLDQIPGRKLNGSSLLYLFWKTSFFFLFRPGRAGLNLVAILTVAMVVAACGSREPRPRSLMEITLTQVKSQTLRGVLYNDEFASKATLSASYVNRTLADQLARQRYEDFKSLNYRDPANIFSPWSWDQNDYVFVTGIQGLNFKPEDLSSKTVRWRLNLILLDDNRNSLAVIPAKLVEHGKNPRDLIDYFPHLTNWDEVYTAFFTLNDQRLKGRVRTLRLELSGPSGRIELDFPASNY